MTRKDRIDLALHFALGILIAFALLGIFAAFPGPVPTRLWGAVAVWEATWISFARESEQARYQRVPFRHPSDVRNWSPHRWREFAAIPLGALAAVGFALR